MTDPDARLRVILDALVAARPLMREQFTADSCIASTRVGLDVLSYFRIAATEIPVQLVVFNDDAAQALAGGAVTQQELAEQMASIAANEPGGPWSLAVGAPQASATHRPGWAGHLVIGIRSHDVLVDLSADQATRPLKNLHTRALWVQVPNPDWWNDPHGRVGFANPDPSGGVLIYDRVVPDPKGYRRSPNWRGTSRAGGPAVFRALTGRIIRQIREALGDAPST